MTAEEIIKVEIDQLNQEEKEVIKAFDRINNRRDALTDLLEKVSDNGTGAEPKTIDDMLFNLVLAERSINGKASAIREFILRNFDKDEQFTTGDVLEQIYDILKDVQAADVTGAFRVMLNRKQIKIVSKGQRGQRGGRNGQVAKAGVYCLA